MNINPRSFSGGKHFIWMGNSRNVNVGWENKHRVYGCSIHIDIKNEKIWIQWNGTEINIAEELVSMGIPKQDIVIGFHSPHKRQFTDFAMG